MKFKLLKDLPGIKAGSVSKEFNFPDDEELYVKFSDKYEEVFGVDFCKAHPDFFEEVCHICGHSLNSEGSEFCSAKHKDKILVPDNIKIEMCSGYNGIWFGDKQVLFVSHGDSHYKVALRSEHMLVKTQLIPIDRRNLVAGDIAFRYISKDVHKDSEYLENYCIILDDKKHVYADGEDVLVSNSQYCIWYKVIPV